MKRNLNYAAVAAYLNKTLHPSREVGRFQMDNHSSRPVECRRSATEFETQIGTLMCCHNCLALTTLLAIIPFGALHADDSPALKPLPLTASDISRVTGLNIYKFRVAMKPGTSFEIAVSVQDTPDAKPRFLNRHSFTSDADVETVDVLLSFLPRDKTLRGVLLSQDEEVDYRVDCPNCSPSGIATIIPLPLNDVRGTQKILVPMTEKSSRKLSSKNEMCLIAILASKGDWPASLQKRFPRAKISLRFTD